MKIRSEIYVLIKKKHEYPGVHLAATCCYALVGGNLDRPSYYVYFLEIGMAK